MLIPVSFRAHSRALACPSLQCRTPPFYPLIRSIKQGVSKKPSKQGANSLSSAVLFSIPLHFTGVQPEKTHLLPQVPQTTFPGRNCIGRNSISRSSIGRNSTGRNSISRSSISRSSISRSSIWKELHLEITPSAGPLSFPVFCRKVKGSLIRPMTCLPPRAQIWASVSVYGD